MTALDDIFEQRRRNHAKWGADSIEYAADDDPRWPLVLMEEVGELSRALLNEANHAIDYVDPNRVRAELIDVAAVALMWLDARDRDTPNA